MSQKQLKKWVKQTARVPRGYLRYQVMIMLNEEPMSGSEIADRIEEETDGEYRPGSGSIYPVLRKLSELSFIEKLPLEDGVRRYELTSQGRSFFDDNREVLDDIRKRLDSVDPPFAGLLPSFSQLRPHIHRVSKAMMTLGEIPQENWEPKTAERVENLLSTLADELEEVLSIVQKDR